MRNIAPVESSSVKVSSLGYHTERNQEGEVIEEKRRAKKQTLAYTSRLKAFDRRQESKWSK